MRHNLNFSLPLFSQIKHSWKSAIAELNLTSAQVLLWPEERYVLFRIICKIVDEALYRVNRAGLLFPTIENGISFFQPQIKEPSTKFVEGSFIQFFCACQSFHFLSFEAANHAKNTAEVPSTIPKIWTLPLTCLQPNQVWLESITSAEAFLANT
jgi:hypothetical protein